MRSRCLPAPLQLLDRRVLHLSKYSHRYFHLSHLPQITVWHGEGKDTDSSTGYIRTKALEYSETAWTEGNFNSHVGPSVQEILLSPTARGTPQHSPPRTGKLASSSKQLPQSHARHRRRAQTRLRHWGRYQRRIPG